MLSQTFHQEQNAPQISRFDGYADDYRQVINKTITASGEEYEYFVELRVGLMFDRIYRDVSGSKPDNILDFGCGNGATEEYIRKYIPNGTLWGVDESVECIRVAKERNIRTAVFNVVNPDGSIPLPDNSISLAYMNGTMHHVDPEKRLSAFKELRRVLMPGGNLFVFENNPYNPLTRRAMSLNPFDKGVILDTKKMMERRGDSAGLIIVEGWYYFFFPSFMKTLRRYDDKLRFLPFGGQYCVWLKKWLEHRNELQSDDPH
jgi:SAM-dependent methyltransferase